MCDPITDSFMGCGLNVEEQIGVKTSLMRLQLNENLPSARFFGKVFAVKKNYLIIQADVVAEQHIKKKFYYSVDDGVAFAELPPVDSFVKEKGPKMRGLLTGDTAFLYEDLEEKKAEEEAAKKKEEEEEKAAEERAKKQEEGGDEEKKEEEAAANKDAPPPPPKRKLNELERLAFILQNLDMDTAVVPKDAHSMTSMKQIIDNPRFSGLTALEARDLSSYLHFRDPENPKVKLRVQRKGLPGGTFLDSLDGDLPKGFWSVQVDPSGTSVSLRSLIWPGYEFRHQLGTAKFGAAYYGWGEKCTDALFLL